MWGQLSIIGPQLISEEGRVWGGGGDKGKMKRYSKLESREQYQSGGEGGEKVTNIKKKG